MFLQRLELQGFKSFAGKTVIDFPDGITAIVGPNGSGKSNVTDAIRWLLGEREAKNLRGGKADDLIFAGTEKRARMGMAQASIYFDNSSGFFPVDYKEVVITRRIDRDGDSKFYINQTEMRLKDIIDFFARARLGARGLNIISQGESDAFLRATPVGRRELVEEVLGLKEYLIKKNTANRELRNTSSNLDKARAMAEEIKPHLRMLKRQVGRYEERDNFVKELKELENVFFGLKLKDLYLEAQKYDPEINRIDQEISLKERELKALEEKFNAVEHSEPQARNDLELIRQKRRELFSERMNFQNEMLLKMSEAQKPKEREIAEEAEKKTRHPMEVLREVKRLAQGVIEKTDMRELKSILGRMITLIVEFEEERRAAFEQNQSSQSTEARKEAPTMAPEMEAKLREFEKLFEELDVAEKRASQEIEGFNQVFRDALVVIEETRDNLRKINERKERLTFEREKIKYREAELDNQLKAIGRSIGEFSTENLSFEGNDINQIERRIYRLRSELMAIGEIDETIVKEAKETEERYNFLETQIADLEKASGDLKALVRELEYKIHHEFVGALEKINGGLSEFSEMMFGGGKIALRLQDIQKPEILPEGVFNENILQDENQDEELRQGIEIEVALPKKRIKGLEVLSGGERSLLSIAVLFGLISISPPPFIVFDEVDAALDERNARKFGEMLRKFEGKSQFVVVTHNRSTMESADALYGVTMGDDGSSRVVSLKLS